MLFKDCLCFSVGKVSRKMSRITRDRLTPYGLTPTQFFLLTALYEEDGLLISALAQKVALGQSHPYRSFGSSGTGRSYREEGRS